MHLALGVAAGGEGVEPPAAIFAQDALGKHRARRIAGAKEQDIEDAFSHRRKLSGNRG